MHALTVGELAWLALVPCALVLVAAIVALGPPLGSLLAPSGASGFWPRFVADDVIRPEPTEHARYLLALLGPVLVGAAALGLARRRPALPRGVASVLVTASEVVLVLFVVAAVLYQHQFTYDASYVGTPFKTVYFTAGTLVASLALATLSAVALRSPSLVARLARAARETAAMRAAALGAAVLLVVVWLLTAFNTDASMAGVNGNLGDNIPFWTDEAFSILNGQAPLVDFHAQYGQLWAYAGAGAMALFGTSFTVYASTMLAGTAVTLLAVYATFRRVAASSLVALLLFLPFVATSFFMEVGPLEDRYGPANLFSMFPIRYAGPYVLLWMVVRRVERRPTRPPFAPFVVAGLAVINNVEFGVPAFGAALVALLAAESDRSPARIARLCGSAVAGLAGSMVIVSLLTLAVASSLPDFGMLATFPRIYGAEGFGMLPMPSFGLHLAVYVTSAAALVVAAVRVVGGDDDAKLTGALAWAGIYGLGAGAYFVGRSHPHVLVDVFSAWSLALSLLLLTTVRGILRRPARRATVVELLVLAGFGLTVCSLAQTPAPWTQLRRIHDATLLAPDAQFLMLGRREMVAQLTRKGERVALLMKEGHRIAEDVGVVDVTPYANLESMLTVDQWREMVQALRNADGTKILVPRERLFKEHVAWLRKHGYVLRSEANEVGLIEFVARR